MTQAPAPAPWQPEAAALAVMRDKRAQSSIARKVADFYRIRRLQNLIRRLCLRLEGGAMFSATWRDILHRFHGVSVGQYSYGDVLTPGVLPRGTCVGRYCSVGSGLIVRRRNHPIERSFLHPFFYNSRLGFLAADTIAADQDNPLVIGHDVWIADRVTILSGCRSIGNGAVIAAGSVVTHDVPAYMIVAGVPAKPMRTRFGPDKIAELEASRWWDHPIAQLISAPPVKDIFGALQEPLQQPEQ